MRNKTLITTSLILFVLVLIGVTIIEPLNKLYSWLELFTPMIVLTGFFTFIVSVALFLYAIISGMKKGR
ncbi:hypothetical protein M0R19_01720 [Candidatus Pacearchaeota archaeon]|jgi:Na+-driven multidrug efflux pump|nr:hypothetical protein [Candidatus Pacearchaeota archaeon]